MATEPQSSSQAPVKTSLRISNQYMSVCGMYTYPKTWVVGREKKLASKQKLYHLKPKHCIAMPMHANLSGVAPNIPGTTAALPWF